MPLGRAIFRIMLDLNPSVYVIIDPCCPQMLEKMGPPDITGFGFQIKPASSLRSPPHQARKPNLSGPPEATTILTQGATIHSPGVCSRRVGGKNNATAPCLG